MPIIRTPTSRTPLDALCAERDSLREQLTEGLAQLGRIEERVAELTHACADLELAIAAFDAAIARLDPGVTLSIAGLDQAAMDRLGALAPCTHTQPVLGCYGGCWPQGG